MSIQIGQCVDRPTSLPRTPSGPTAPLAARTRCKASFFGQSQASASPRTTTQSRYIIDAANRPPIINPRILSYNNERTARTFHRPLRTCSNRLSRQRSASVPSRPRPNASHGCDLSECVPTADARDADNAHTDSKAIARMIELRDPTVISLTGVKTKANTIQRPCIERTALSSTAWTPTHSRYRRTKMTPAHPSTPMLPQCSYSGNAGAPRVAASAIPTFYTPPCTGNARAPRDQSSRIQVHLRYLCTTILP